jgi:hypothetical protein
MDGFTVLTKGFEVLQDKNRVVEQVLRRREMAENSKAKRLSQEKTA